MFNFVDEQGRSLPLEIHPTVRINGKKLSAPGMEIEERDLRQANVEANAKEQGYEGNAKFVDFTESAPYTLTLTRRVRDWKKKVKMRNGETADMTLVSKYIPNHKNGPLMGYNYDPRTGNLVYDTGRIWAHRAQGLLAGLLLMGLCWGISAIVHSTKNRQQQQVEAPSNPNQRNDTLQLVTLSVSNVLTATGVADEGTFHVTVVKRDAGWQVRMEGLPQSGMRSRD